MPSKQRVLGLLVAALLSSSTGFAAIKCHTNCERKCRIRLPWGGHISEPGCRFDCEAKKRVACAAGPKVSVQEPPGSPSTLPDIVDRASLAVCANKFETITRSLILSCSGFRAPNHDQEVIARARGELIRFGFAEASEFNGVSIKFCQLTGSTAGVVPDRNVILLDHSFNPFSRSYDPDNLGMVGLGALLDHEMVHVRQYRKLGTDEFKCSYVEHFERCAGCQDKRHPFELTAYNEQEHVADVLEVKLRSSSCNTFDGRSCDTSDSYYGEPCSCYDARGREYPGLIAW